VDNNPHDHCHDACGKPINCDEAGCSTCAGCRTCWDCLSCCCANCGSKEEAELCGAGCPHL
jgi:hypothetical protein